MAVGARMQLNGVYDSPQRTSADTSVPPSSRTTTLIRSPSTCCKDPESVFAITLPKHRRQFILTQNNFHPLSAALRKRPQSAMTRPRVNQVCPTPDPPIAPKPRPQTAHRRLSKAPPTFLVARPASASRPLIAKRPTLPAAWLLMQRELQNQAPPLTTGAIAAQLTRKEIELQRLVTTGAHRCLNDTKIAHDQKQKELRFLQHGITEHWKELPSTSSGDTSVEARVVELKDELRRANAYTGGLQRMYERTKADGHAQQITASTTRSRAGTLAKEWQALNARRHHFENAALERVKRLAALRRKKEATDANATAVIVHMKTELKQGSELERWRIEADKKRANLVRTFRSPLVEDKSTRLGRANTKLLLFREAVLSTKENQFDELVRESGESNIHTLVQRFTSYSTDFATLNQMDAESCVALEAVEQRLESLEVQVRELQTGGIEHVVETQRRAKARLEEKLWSAKMHEDKVAATLRSQQQTISVLHQGLLAIADILACLDTVATDRHTAASTLELATRCVGLLKRHRVREPVLSATALQEVLEHIAHIAPSRSVVPPTTACSNKFG
ncbi:hypothetical protein SDRG_13329 [Saprolegnia diclina VS20]|uniref:DUF4200 domain-containing protein n=1 Tax=Saprolegnia diclina (strain VS20) TaxID=1156394 RepID=T0RGT5_SAPDV|nr:hypothetical protein SDRG_13329 [Saprolegnia diclina VS20]EQC28992.1 hypothetical protein SDRG_13329 [Saprolegnia diclina VS20]|eukprot:XP_008617631.1 hypothetical protein SDRG_13329 [Saprolegnia diclina VS20]